MTSMVAVCAILCRRVVQPPMATVCSGETPYRLRSPIVLLVPSMFVVAPASSALCLSRCVENDSTIFACPCLDHKSQALRQRQTKNVFCNVFHRCCGSLVKAQASARVHVPRAPHFVAVRTKESKTYVQVFLERESLDMCSTDNPP